MLKQCAQWALAASLIVWTGCSHSVTPRPNVETDLTTGQQLMLENRTTNALTLLPAPGRGETNVTVLQPLASAALNFQLSKQTNRSAAGETELLLVATNSSPYVGQSATDLIILARFGSSAFVRELRVVPGLCLFGTNAATQHTLAITNVPLAGVPLKRLCPQ